MHIPAVFQLINTFALLFWVFMLQWESIGSQFVELAGTVKDKRLIGKTIKTFFSSLNQCFMECSSHKNCYSLNFNLVSGLCELNDATHLSNPDAFQRVPHVVYMMYTLRHVPHRDCIIERALGMEDRSIPDSAITASTVYSGSHHRYPPDEGRLRNTRNVKVYERSGCWAPSTSSNCYFQVDLGQTMFVTKIATQGNEWTPVNEYVLTYEIAYSLDNTNWQGYKENNALKVFDGNTDGNTIVTNSFSSTIKARYMRVLPKTWISWVSLRVEFYGCNLQ